MSTLKSIIARAKRRKLINTRKIKRASNKPVKSNYKYFERLVKEIDRNNKIQLDINSFQKYNKKLKNAVDKTYNHILYLEAIIRDSETWTEENKKTQKNREDNRKKLNKIKQDLINTPRGYKFTTTRAAFELKQIIEDEYLAYN